MTFQLGTTPLPHEMLNPVFLNGVLNKAIQFSSKSSSDDSASNLSFVLKYLPKVLHPNGTKNTATGSY